MLTPLKHERYRLGLKQFDISMKTGILPYKLSLIENGKLEPTPRELQMLLRVIPTLRDFGVKINEGVER